MKVSEKQVSIPIDITPDQAWAIIGAASGVDKWFSEVITACRVDGNKRFCTTAQGAFEEDILKIDHENKVFKYSIPEQNLLPAKDIIGTMAVSVDNNKRTVINWNWQFKVHEDEESSVLDALDGMGQMGISGIERYALELSQSAV